MQGLRRRRRSRGPFRAPPSAGQRLHGSGSRLADSRLEVRIIRDQKVEGPLRRRTRDQPDQGPRARGDGWLPVQPCGSGFDADVSGSQESPLKREPALRRNSTKSNVAAQIKVQSQSPIRRARVETQRSPAWIHSFRFAAIARSLDGRLAGRPFGRLLPRDEPPRSRISDEQAAAGSSGSALAVSDSRRGAGVGTD